MIASTLNCYRKQLWRQGEDRDHLEWMLMVGSLYSYQIILGTDHRIWDREAPQKALLWKGLTQKFRKIFACNWNTLAYYWQISRVSISRKRLFNHRITAWHRLWSSSKCNAFHIWRGKSQSCTLDSCWQYFQCSKLKGVLS